MSPLALPESVLAAVEASAGRVLQVAAVGGGCIAHASRVETSAGPLFLKWAAGAAGAGFEGEAAGLRALAAAAPAEIAVPLPLDAAASAAEEPGFLLTEWIEPAQAGPHHWEKFGRALAALHRAASGGGGGYGFNTDTYCGPTRQPNAWTDDWPAFFRDRRLGHLASLLRESGRWTRDMERMFDRLLTRLDDELPARPPPALLHGDLWSGNAFAAAGGVTALVDPATYVGDRETDLAMTELFGGFDPSFLEAYDEAWPLEPGYERRRAIYQLYHLMNHLLLFGDSYAGAVSRTLSDIGG